MTRMILAENKNGGGRRENLEEILLAFADFRLASISTPLCVLRIESAKK
jgi:hypothetical protein